MLEGSNGCGKSFVTAICKAQPVCVFTEFVIGNDQIKIQSRRFSIKTHDSESRGQEEAAIIRETKNTRPLSELFTRKTVQKIATALTKPP